MNDDTTLPRIRIIETTGPEFRRNNRNKQRRSRNDHVEQPDVLQQWPLEALSIRRAVLEYGRRTAALGAQHGAIALKMIASKIRDLGPPTPDLERIMLDAENEAIRLRAMLDE